MYGVPHYQPNHPPRIPNTSNYGHIQELCGKSISEMNLGAREADLNLWKLSREPQAKNFYKDTCGPIDS